MHYDFGLIRRLFLCSNLPIAIDSPMTESISFSRKGVQEGQWLTVH
jgi:hypothetical protein